MSTAANQDLEQLIKLLQQKGITNQSVLNAMRNVPRHLFVEPSLIAQAYIDSPLPTVHGQTISQPFVVARMTELLLGENKINKVLEIGTGSGYQTAVLAQLIPEVYTIERVQLLYEQAGIRFQQSHLRNIHQRFADGKYGWPEAAPFDGIIVTAATPAVPQVLLHQLADNGRMIIPVGDALGQELQLIKRKGNNFVTEILDPVIFVPLLSGIEKEK